jgi:hypothetical protein
MHTDITTGDGSIFQKFGGIRPMAAKLSVPPSTVKSWHRSRAIPEWRRKGVMEAAIQHGIKITFDEIENVRADAAEAA